MLSDRLKQAMAASGIKQADLARACKVKPPSIHGWLNNKSKFLRGENLLLAAKALGVSQTWLATGEGSMHVVAKSSNIAPAAIGRTQIPLIDYVQAGMWTEVSNPYEAGDGSEFLLTDLELSASAFALEIKGNSMAPEFNPGDRVIIDPDVTPQAGDYVVAKNGGEEATFKKYRLRGHNDQGDEVFELIPLNEDYAPMRSDQQPIQIVGTMVEHRKYRKKR